MRVLAMRDISEGEELTISYTNRFQPIKLRQEFLQTQFHFRCNCSECQFETSHPVSLYIESILDQNLPLELRLKTLKDLIGTRNLLFAYYLSALQPELTQKINTHDLHEANVILDMLISRENDILIDIPDLKMQRDIYFISIACEASRNSQGPTPRLRDLEARRDKIISYLKGCDSINWERK